MPKRIHITIWIITYHRSIVKANHDKSKKITWEGRELLHNIHSGFCYFLWLMHIRRHQTWFLAKFRAHRFVNSPTESGMEASCKYLKCMFYFYFSFFLHIRNFVWIDSLFGFEEWTTLKKGKGKEEVYRANFKIFAWYIPPNHCHITNLECFFGSKPQCGWKNRKI